MNRLQDEDATAVTGAEQLPQPVAPPPGRAAAATAPAARRFALRRMLSYSRREALELRRDPIRMTLAGLGTVILLFIMGYGINWDVEDLTFAVLDRDQTTTSRDYALEIAGPSMRCNTNRRPSTHGLASPPTLVMMPVTASMRRNRRLSLSITNTLPAASRAMPTGVSMHAEVVHPPHVALRRQVSWSGFSRVRSEWPRGWPGTRR